jgi:hypothetical protein
VVGHHSPAYTLSEYVHLIDAGVGETAFLDAITRVPPPDRQPPAISEVTRRASRGTRRSS